MKQFFLVIVILLATELSGQIESLQDELTTDPNTYMRKIENSFGIRSIVNNESAYTQLGNSHTRYGHINNADNSNKASLFYGQMEGKHVVEYGLYLDDLNPQGSDGNITMKHFIEGNVGLGVTNPKAALDVLGNVRLGSYTGQNYNGTPSYLLGVDDKGNVIKTSLSNLQNSKTQTTKEKNDYDRQLSMLQDYISQLEKRLTLLETKQDETLTQIEVSLSNSIEIEQAYISQNLPNPSSHTSTIKYYIPETASEASVKFFSLSGQIIKEVDIDQLGQGEIKLDLERMITGNYKYALVVDGELIDTKTMVVVK